MVANDYGTTTSSCDVTVEFELPDFTEPLKDTAATLNEDVTLECRVSGKPEPTTQWLVSGLVMESTEKYQQSRTDETASMTVTNVTVDDTEMTYSCRAVNPAGEATSTAHLFLQGLLPVFVSSLSSACAGLRHDLPGATSAYRGPAKGLL